MEIGKINSTTKFLSRMIKNLPKNLGMFDALIELISNKTFSSAFFFNGQENSYIRLQPLYDGEISNGICYISNIRIESKGLERKMCLWSFIDVSVNNKGIELFLCDNSLILHAIKRHDENTQTLFTITETNFQENEWYSIIFALINKRVIGYINNRKFEMDFKEDILPKKCNSVLVGASYDIISGNPNDFFFGEMTSVYFLSCTSRFNKSVNEMPLNCFDHDKLFMDPQILKENAEYYQCNSFLKSSYLHKDILSSLFYKMEIIVNRI